MKAIYKSMVVAAAIVAANPGMAAPATTLQEIVESAVTNNPEVQSRYHNYKAAEQEQNAARGGFFPKVDLISSIRTQEKVFSNVNNTNIPDRQTQLVLKQMLFDGFATSNEVSRLGHAARVRYYELLSAMQNTALETVKAYNDVLRYRQLVSYAEDNYIVHKQLFDKIEERVGAGVGRRVDLEQANGRLALAEANLLTETTNLHDVTARFQRLVGDLPADTLSDVDYFRAGVEQSPADALKLAYNQNPDLLASIENIIATEDEVKTKKARYSPRLDLQGKKSLDVSSDGRNSTAAADYLELTLTFNLFNGLTDKSLISQSVEKLNTSQDLRDKACVDTRQQLVIAYNDISQLKGQLDFRDQHQLSIEKAREAYRRQFDIGQRTLLDLLDTENEYFQARRTYTNTERDLYNAYARTYASQGELLKKLNVTRSDVPELTPTDYNAYATCQAVAPEVVKIDKVALLAKARPLNTEPLKPAEVKFGEADLVKSTVNDWASAWQAKDYNRYIGFYADNFVPEKGSRAAWLQQRKQRFAAPGTIVVELKDLKVSLDGTQAQASVSFMQHFSSGKYSDDTMKYLTLEKTNNRWLITKESSR